MNQDDDLAGAAADREVVLDLDDVLISPQKATGSADGASETHKGAPSWKLEGKPEAASDKSGGAFARFAFGKSGGGTSGGVPAAEAQKGGDPMSSQEFAAMASGGAPPQQRKRLGTLRQDINRMGGGPRSGGGLSRLSSGGSGSPHLLKKRARSALQSDDDDLDTPLDRRNGAKKARQRIQGLSDDEEEADEGEDDNIQVIPDSEPPAEPTMRQRVDATKSYGPKMVDLDEVGEVLEEDAVDGLLQQCEDISDKLRKALGGTQDGNKLEALEGGAGMATPELLTSACGPTARYIKSYQIIGINFLLLLAREGVEGSILADEMGLGKTAQTICFLGCLRKVMNDKGPHLVICPASLLENWERELQRWCPDMVVVSYHGANRAEIRYKLELLRGKGGNQAASKSEEMEEDGVEEEDGEEDGEGDDESEGGSQSEASEYDGEEEEGGGSAGKDRAASHKQAGPREEEGEPPFNVMLCCYTLFERDSTEQRLDRKFLRGWKWSHLILDEAHAVKNSSAQRTVRLTKIAERCRRRVMLTGTPLQNDLEELQNLLRFLMPKLFTAEDAAEITNVQGEEEVGRLAERMQNLLRPFVLRRLKTEVASQLAPKQHRLHCVPMTPSQAEQYSRAVANLRKELVPKKAAAGTQTEGEQEAAKKLAEAAKAVKKLGQRKMGNAFVALRKIALHPLLARNIFTDAQLKEMAKLAYRRDLFGGQATEAKVLEELQGYSDFELHGLAKSNGTPFSKFVLQEEHLYTSAKCCLLAKLLPELKAAGSRPLIFSQWTMMLDILEWLLDSLKLPYVRLDGSTAVADRLTIVDMFNNAENGVFAFLLSTRAGGQGLNLTGADTVILHDVDFNPQVDRQAEDRCHRLGQTRPVTVIRLVTKGTVDEGIHALAEKKLRLDAAVLDGITASSKQAKASENLAMSELLQSLIAGDPAGRPLGEDGNPIDIPQGEEVTVAELEAIAQAHSKATAGNAQGNGTANGGHTKGEGPEETKPSKPEAAITVDSDDEVLVLSPISVTKQNRVGSAKGKQGGKKTPSKGSKATPSKA